MNKFKKILKIIFCIAYLPLILAQENKVDSDIICVGGLLWYYKDDIAPIMGLDQNLFLDENKNKFLCVANAMELEQPKIKNAESKIQKNELLCPFCNFKNSYSDRFCLNCAKEVRKPDDSEILTNKINNLWLTRQKYLLNLFRQGILYPGMPKELAEAVWGRPSDIKIISKDIIQWKYTKAIISLRPIFHRENISGYKEILRNEWVAAGNKKYNWVGFGEIQNSYSSFNYSNEYKTVVKDYLGEQNIASITFIKGRVSDYFIF